MVCCYTRGIDGALLNKIFAVTSEATNHSRIVAPSCINLIINSLQKKFPSQFNNYPVFYIGSDLLLHIKVCFALMTHFNPDYTIQWHYNERHPGKGAIDDVGETIKNILFRHVKFKKMCD